MNNIPNSPYPEEKARLKIDKQLRDAGWDIVSRDEYNPLYSQAVKEALMKGNTESDYLLFIDNKAIAVVEAKREENCLGDKVAAQAEYYAAHPQNWYGLWFSKVIPLVYLANGNKIYFKNLLCPKRDYEEISAMHSPKEMLRILRLSSEYGALPRIEKKGLRECQYDAETSLERSFKEGKKRALAVLATGAGKTYLACLASYRLLNYTSAVKRVLFLVDRNNLARQTEQEFSQFSLTEERMALTSLYRICRLRKNEDVNGDIVISTIQKLFAVMKGESLFETDEDSEDEALSAENEHASSEEVNLGSDIKLSPNHFQFIVVDECHRSIYGRWRPVLEYFTGAKILGLTATPVKETDAFFNKNIIEKYTNEESVADGVNVPPRIYRIKTEKTENGGVIDKGSTVIDVPKSGEGSSSYVSGVRSDYSSSDLDRSVINRDQIDTVLSAYRDAIYSELYPNRDVMWEYIPKTLIFAKNDRHADEIVSSVKRVFSVMFPEGVVPEGFAQKITYSAGDSNALIREFKGSKSFRIAVTVTLVSTGTDIKPLEIVLFMADIKSPVLYEQMKGRGCRVIGIEKLREVTPNADEKECYYVVDAVGVTEGEKIIPQVSHGDRSGKKFLLLKELLERLAHGEVSDDNLMLLSNYCAAISNKYEEDKLFGHHLDAFIDDFGFSPRELAGRIAMAIERAELPLYEGVSAVNRERKALISCLINDVDARSRLVELKAGYYALTTDDYDSVIYSGFSQDEARSFIENFERCLDENKDSVEALRIIYHSEEKLITHSMLADLQDKLLSMNSDFKPGKIWRHYRVCDADSVDELDTKYNVNALTNLIQIARYAYHKSGRLSTLFGVFSQRFNLYCGQEQRDLSAEQRDVMFKIAEYVVRDGSFTSMELNESDADLWRRGMSAFFTKSVFETEIQIVSKFILKEAVV